MSIKKLPAEILASLSLEAEASATCLKCRKKTKKPVSWFQDHSTCPRTGCGGPLNIKQVLKAREFPVKLDKKIERIRRTEDAIQKRLQGSGK